MNTNAFSYSPEDPTDRLQSLTEALRLSLHRRRRRKPVFSLTPEQTLRLCKDKGHCPMVAGQILALRSLMEQCGWTILETAEHSQISRPMISEMLNVQTCASTNTINTLACTFGMDHLEYTFSPTFA